MHPLVGVGNSMKLKFKGVDIWKRVFRQQSYDTRSTRGDTVLNKVINQALRFYPLPEGQSCNNVVCRRASFCYGLLWLHEHMDDQLHEHVDKMLGSINVTTM